MDFKSLDEIGAMLDSGSEEVRIDAACHLSAGAFHGRDDPDPWALADLLLRALGDASPKVRHQAARTLRIYPMQMPRRLRRRIG